MANKGKPPKEGKLARQKAKAAQQQHSSSHGAGAMHGEDDIEHVPQAATAEPRRKVSPIKPAKEWSDIDLSSPQV